MSQDKLDIIIYLVIFLVLINIFLLISNYYRSRVTGDHYFELINYHLAKGEFEKAFLECKKLHKKRPYDSNVLLITAITLFRAGKNQEAKKLFEKLVTKDPQFKTEADKYLDTFTNKT